MKTLLEFIWEKFPDLWSKSPEWIKGTIIIAVTPLVLLGGGLGFFFFIDEWVATKANTVVAPIQIEVRAISKRQDDMIKGMDQKWESIDRKLDILIMRTK